MPVKVTINGYTWRSTVGKRSGIQYIVVNADARRGAGVKAGDSVTITLEPDTEKREIEVSTPLQRALVGLPEAQVGSKPHTAAKVETKGYARAYRRACDSQPRGRLGSASRFVRRISNDKRPSSKVSHGTCSAPES